MEHLRLEDMDLSFRLCNLHTKIGYKVSVYIVTKKEVVGTQKKTRFFVSTSTSLYQVVRLRSGDLYWPT